MSLAAFNVTVPLDGAVVLPPEFAGQEIRIVIEKTFPAVLPAAEPLRAGVEKQGIFWEKFDKICAANHEYIRRQGLDVPSEEEVMAMIKADRRAEGEALQRAKEESLLCAE